MQQQPPGAESQRAEAGEDALGERDAAGGDGAVGGADHARVGGALEGLIEGACSGRDQADADERVEQGRAARWRCRTASIPGRSRAQPVTSDHASDADFEQLAQVVDQRGGCAGAGRVNAPHAAGISAGAARSAGLRPERRESLEMDEDLSRCDAWPRRLL